MSAPLVPSDLDLRDFPFMPVDVRRLLTSETWLTATGDEKAAAMTLWLESWHQVPAGSLPDNDRMLSILSQAGGRWKKVRAAALRGWVKATDGRLYHPVVCEKAMEAWDRKQSQRQRTEAARLARLNRTVGNATTDPVTSSVTEDVTASKGQGQRQREEETPSLRSGSKKASRLPEDWQPSAEDREFAKGEGMAPTDIDREAAKFRDFWLGKRGKDGAKLDWPATWRNWIRRACEMRGISPAANGKDATEDDWRKRLAFARKERKWATSRWGPMPNAPGCLVPPAMIDQTDGTGWAEWGEGH